MCELLAEERGKVGIIVLSMSQQDVDRVAKLPYSMVISDSLYGVSDCPHPRLYGSFPKIIREYVRERQILTMEDPYLNLYVEEETEEIQLQLFGNLQREILQMLLKERFQLKTEFDSVTTVKKDKPLEMITCIVPMNSPGNLFQAGVGLTLEPLEEGSGYQYKTKVSYWDLSKSFQNGVREGVEKGIRKGLYGEVVDTKVTFMYFDYSSVTSTPSDFRRLAEKVVYQAMKEIGTMTMEPVMAYTLTAPQGYEKKLITELVRMNADMDETKYTQTEMIIKGKVTLEACKDFAAHLLTLTGGAGNFETTFWKYRRVETDYRKK